MPITANEMVKELEQQIKAGSWNKVDPEDAICEDLAGMRLYDEPIWGFGNAADLLFETWKRPEVIHPEAMLPRDWLAEAKTVISYFFPFTEQIRHANAEDMARTSDAWLHGRIEGQEMISAVGRELCHILEEAGYKAVCPSLDPRFRMLADYTKGCLAGKDHALCSAYIKENTRPPHGPHKKVRYGCGKCQVDVPCAAGIPKRRGISGSILV